MFIRNYLMNEDKIKILELMKTKTNKQGFPSKFWMMIPLWNNNSSSKKGNKYCRENELSDDKIESQELGTITFLDMLNMKKLDSKHELRYSWTAFIECIPEIEITFSSNEYTRTVNYPTNNKISLTRYKGWSHSIHSIICFPW